MEFSLRNDVKGAAIKYRKRKRKRKREGVCVSRGNGKLIIREIKS